MGSNARSRITVDVTIDVATNLINTQPMECTH
jgi:hypothetical protein